MSNNEISVLVGLLILVFVVISKNTRTRKNVLPKIGSINIGDFQKNIEGWFPDWNKFLSSIGVIFGINLMFMFMTKNWPDLWNSYYEKGSSFFWTFNLALVFFAFLMSKKSKDNKPVPEARTKAKIVMSALVILSFINFAGRFGGSSTTSLTKSAVFRKVVHQEYVSLDSQLTEYGNCEAPGEPGGKQWEDEEKKIPVKGKKDPDDTGALQINTRIHADLIKETGIDPAKSKEDNYRLGRIILERYLANPSAYKEHPWEASRYCWEPVLTGSSPVVDRLAPKTLDLKAGIWSKPEQNKTTATPKKMYWFTKNLDCKVRVDGKEHPITVDLKGTVPDQYEFMCPSDTTIRLEWF